MVVSHIGNVAARGIAVQHIVHIAGEIDIRIVNAGDGKHTVENIRAAEKQIAGMHSAHGRAKHHNRLVKAVVQTA